MTNTPQPSLPTTSNTTSISRTRYRINRPKASNLPQFLNQSTSLPSQTKRRIPTSSPLSPPHPINPRQHYHPPTTAPTRPQTTPNTPHYPSPSTQAKLVQAPTRKKSIPSTTNTSRLLLHHLRRLRSLRYPRYCRRVLNLSGSIT